jgi:hypothetical protein
MLSSRSIAMRWTSVLLAAAVSCQAAQAEETTFAFRPAQPGFFSFDTGTIRGTVRQDGSSQGVSSLVHVPTGVEVAHGGGLPGVLSYYRVFAADLRFSGDLRDRTAQCRILPDGALEAVWPANEKYPLAAKAAYRLRRSAIDVETTVTPNRDLPKFEVFLSSYFSPGFRALVYVKPNLFAGGRPELLPADVNPLVEGSYLMFPRDREAVRMIFDRRWEFPPNPVQWSVARWLAGPLAVRRDDKSGVAAVLMSSPEDCFAVATPYNRTPPDGVAGHQSLYLSLFGGDVKAGQSATARCRLAVGKLSDAEAIALYNDYLKQRKAP